MIRTVRESAADWSESQVWKQNKVTVVLAYRGSQASHRTKCFMQT